MKAPNTPLTRILFTALATMMTAPVWAQMLPEISIRPANVDTVIAESLILPCNTAGSNRGLRIQISASRPANGVTVNTRAFTVSGHDRFRDNGVPPYNEDPHNGPVIYRHTGAATYTGNSTRWFRLAQFSGGMGSPCFRDDALISGDSVIEVVLMPGTGYTINPQMRTVRLTVRD